MQLSADDKAKRVDAICSWIEDNIDFKNAFFGDEKKFNMGGPDNWYILNYEMYVYKCIT